MKLMKIRMAASLAFVLGAGVLSCGSDGPVATNAQAISAVSLPPPPSTLPTANEFHLGAGDISIVYAPEARPEVPVLTYRDPTGSWSFRHGDLQITPTPAGSMISAVRRNDDGSTATLSLLVPRVQLRATGGALVYTVAITTVHRDHAEADGTALDVPTYGQLDEYEFWTVAGTANHIETKPF